LIAIDLPRGVTRGKAALGSQQQGAIFSPHRDFEIAHVILTLDISVESVALASVDTNVFVEVYGEHLFAPFIA